MPKFGPKLLVLSPVTPPSSPPRPIEKSSNKHIMWTWNDQLCRNIHLVQIGRGRVNYTLFCYDLQEVVTKWELLGNKLAVLVPWSLVFVVIWAGLLCCVASSFVFCIFTMVPCRLSCHNDCTSVKSFDLCRRFCRYRDPGSHLLNQPSHTSPKGLADLSQKKIADYLSKSGGAGNTFHGIILMFLELMSVLAQRLINCIDLVREMKLQWRRVGY